VCCRRRTLRRSRTRASPRSSANVSSAVNRRSLRSRKRSSRLPFHRCEYSRVLHSCLWDRIDDRTRNQLSQAIRRRARSGKQLATATIQSGPTKRQLQQKVIELERKIEDLSPATHASRECIEESEPASRKRRKMVAPTSLAISTLSSASTPTSQLSSSFAPAPAIMPGEAAPQSPPRSTMSDVARPLLMQHYYLAK
jgi:hypothetical protein